MGVTVNATKSGLAALFALAFASACPAAPAVADCASEAAALEKEQADLPRIEFASPADRPPYCITLETLMAYAARVKAHVAHCPNSDYVQSVAQWEKTRTDYSRRFSQYRCKRTL